MYATDTTRITDQIDMNTLVSCNLMSWQWCCYGAANVPNITDK